jgi:lipoic acid synthetase
VVQNGSIKMPNLVAPAWLVAEVRRAKKGTSTDQIEQTSGLLSRLGLTTVCDSARCPNRGECFSHRTVTFLILGDVCTRGCTFCAVRLGRPDGPLDADEPERLSQAVGELGLAHVVITSVTRDDLPDSGAVHYAKTVEALRRHCPTVTIELLVPDFMGSDKALSTVLAACPDILAHNIETVPRLYREVRRGADYHRSLWVLHKAKVLAPQIITKSGVMLGLGESDEEVRAVLYDLAATGCEMVTLGQYLAPSLTSTPVARYVLHNEFDQWRTNALAMGFKSVVSGPLVRSSYKASLFFGELA